MVAVFAGVAGAGVDGADAFSPELESEEEEEEEDSVLLLPLLLLSLSFPLPVFPAGVDSFLA